MKYLSAVLLILAVLTSGCVNINPLNPESPGPAKLPTETAPPPSEVRVTYYYNGSGKVQLSANDVVLKIGQRLVLQPAPGLTKNTRFVSEGEYFFGDIMRQEDVQDTTKAVFTAIKPGKGRLKIIPNATEVERAVDFWVTVQ